MTYTGLYSAKAFGLDDAMTEQLLVKEGATNPAMVKLIGEATRETHGGKFFNYDGTEAIW
jgi:hypothetical protein